MIGRLLPVRLQLTPAISQGEPGSHLLAQRSRGAGRGSPGSLGGLVLGSLVLLQQALKFFVRVAALARQILLSVLKLVLIEFQLRFRQRKLTGGRIIGSGRLGQLGDAVLVQGDLRLPPGGPVRKVFERTSGGHAKRGSFAQRGGKRLVEFTIGKAQRIPRERLLLRCIGQSVHLLRTLQQTAVYGRRRIGRGGLPCRGLVGTQVTREVRRDEAGNQQNRQNCRKQTVEASHRCLAARGRNPKSFVRRRHAGKTKGVRCRFIGFG